MPGLLSRISRNISHLRNTRPVTMAKTIVLVTGANQGIGFEIAKKLATEQPGYHVIMAGRRKEAIEEASQTLLKQGLSVEPLVLDVTLDASIHTATEAVRAKHGHIDVLINNAAISTGASEVGIERAVLVNIFATNVVGVAAVTDAFLPLLEKSPLTKRIVFVSSTLGSMGLRMEPGSQTHKILGYPMYSSSKAALNMLAAHYMVKYEEDKTWKINATCPGYCATNLNGYNGVFPADTGAIQPCHLATLGPDGVTGTFSRKEGPIPW